MSGYTLHDYQIVAREFLRGRPAAGLFLDMGLGKTAVTLSALEPRHLPALVVAPKRVAENVWDAEAELWRPDLTISVAKGGPAARAKALASGADVVVLGRDNLGDIDPKDHPFRTVVVDELSGFKSRKSARWKAMRKIVSNLGVGYVWGLTGTPAPNGMMDLWAQIGLLDGGERLGKNITTFRSKYFTPGAQIANGTIVSWDLRPGYHTKIYAKIEDICLSMVAEGRIKLPSVTFNDIVIDLPPAVTEAYRTIKDNLVVDLRDIFGGEVHSADNAAILTSKLSQIAAGFLFEDAVYEADDYSPEGGHQVNPGAYTWLHDGTINAVREIVEGTGSPVIVFYRFIPERDALLAAFGKDAHTADEPDLQARWNAGEFPILLAHPGSVGHGLNLQYGGHTIVWASPTWELELWEQGNGRLARQGQTNPVVIHSVIRRNTIDTHMRQRVDRKATVQGDLMNHLESPV